MTKEDACGECPVCERTYTVEELMKVLREAPEARASVGSGLIQRVVICPECRAKQAREDQGSSGRRRRAADA